MVKKKSIKSKLSSSEFKSKAPDYEIKRVGKNFVIISKNNGAGVPVSRANIAALRESIDKTGAPVKIQVTGLSRSQLSRIAGDLQEKSSKQAFIKKNDVIKRSTPQPISYEILLKKGE